MVSSSVLHSGPILERHRREHAVKNQINARLRTTVLRLSLYKNKYHCCLCEYIMPWLFLSATAQQHKPVTMASRPGVDSRPTKRQSLSYALTSFAVPSNPTATLEASWRNSDEVGGGGCAFASTTTVSRNTLTAPRNSSVRSVITPRNQACTKKTGVSTRQPQ